MPSYNHRLLHLYVNISLMLFFNLNFSVGSTKGEKPKQGFSFYQNCKEKDRLPPSGKWAEFLRGSGFNHRTGSE